MWYLLLLLPLFPRFAIGGSISGTASFTGGDLSGGTCSFSALDLPTYISGTGIGPSNWNSGGLCGACLQVDGPRGSVKVMVVDSCPTCEENWLNLYAEAFEQIGDPLDGIIDVSFDIVSCEMPSGITIRNKEGTSRWFFSMQVMNANYPIVSLEVSNDGGATWYGTERQDYNYFERSDKTGFEKDKVDVRILCSNNNGVVIPQVSMESELILATNINC